MKAERARRVVTLCLCLLACVVVFVVVLGAGKAADEAVAATIGPQVPQQLGPDLHINIGDLLAAAPTITDVNPNGGLTTGGTEVVIIGTGFSGATAVTFGGTPASAYTVDSSTQITAHAPAHAAGTVQVRVTASSSLVSSDTSADDYTYVAAPATTATPTTATPTTATPTTAAPTTAAPTVTTDMVATTVAAAGQGDGGLSGGWIAFIVLIAVIAVAAMGGMAYALLRGGGKGGPAA